MLHSLVAYVMLYCLDHVSSLHLPGTLHALALLMQLLDARPNAHVYDSTPCAFSSVRGPCCWSFVTPSHRGTGT